MAPLEAKGREMAVAAWILLALPGASNQWWQTLQESSISLPISRYEYKEIHVGPVGLSSMICVFVLMRTFS